MGFTVTVLYSFASVGYCFTCSKTSFPTHKQALHSYFAGSFSLIGSQIFTYAATQYLSSGMIALMFGLAPIMAGLIGRFAFGQHLF